MPELTWCTFSNKPYLKLAIYMAIFVSLTSFSYLKKRNTPQLSSCQITPAAGSITPLKDNRTFIIAAYMDKRGGRNRIRVLGIIHHQEVKELYCWFCCPALKKRNISQAEINMDTPRYEFPYGTAYLDCPVPEDCPPRYVAMHWSRHGNIEQMPWFEIQNRDLKDPPVEFTVCVSPMYGKFNNVLQLVQSIEMYKILGARKVTIYKNSCSNMTEKVLDFYVAEGIVEIIPWPIDSYLSVSPYWHYKQGGKDIGYYGQVTALNDCLYRNMYKSKYVLLNDIDEIIVPVKYANWGVMMKRLQKRYPQTGVFLFQSHVFPNTIFANNDSFSIPSWDTVPGTNILQHIIREPLKKSGFNHPKMIVNPRKVIQISVHEPIIAHGPSVDVERDFGLLHHCRAPRQPLLPKESLIKDPILWRYNVLFIRNINHVLERTVWHFSTRTEAAKAGGKQLK